MRTLTNLATSALPYFGSGRISRLGTSLRRGMGDSPDSGRLGFLRAVLGSALLAVLDALGIEAAAHDVVAHAGQVFHPASTDQHHRVLLQIVAFPADVTDHLEPVGEAHFRDLAQRRVRLLRCGRIDARAHAALLRRAGERGNLALCGQANPRIAHQLVDCRHYFAFQKRPGRPVCEKRPPRAVRRGGILAGKAVNGQQVISIVHTSVEPADPAPTTPLVEPAADRCQLRIPGSIGHASLDSAYGSFDDQRLVPAHPVARPRAREPRHGIAHVPVFGDRRLHDRLAFCPPGNARQFGRGAPVLRDDRCRANRSHHAGLLGALLRCERSGAAPHRSVLPHAWAGETRDPARSRGPQGVYGRALGCPEVAPPRGRRMAACRPVGDSHGRRRTRPARAHPRGDQGSRREIRRFGAPRRADRFRCDRNTRRPWLPLSRISLAALEPARGRIRRPARRSHALSARGIRRDARRLARSQAARRARVLHRLGGRRLGHRADGGLRPRVEEARLRLDRLLERRPGEKPGHSRRTGLPGAILRARPQGRRHRDRRDRNDHRGKTGRRHRRARQGGHGVACARLFMGSALGLARGARARRRAAHPAAVPARAPGGPGGRFRRAPAHKSLTLACTRVLPPAALQADAAAEHTVASRRRCTAMRGAAGRKLRSSDHAGRHTVEARKNPKKPPDLGEALRQAEERFESLVGLSSDWYWEQDKSYRFTVITGSNLEAAGIDPKRILGTARWDNDAVPVGDGGSWEKHKAVLEARRPFSDFVYQRPDSKGELHCISASGLPVFDGKGRFCGYRGVGKDITARKRAEELQALEHAVNRSLAQADSVAAAVRAVIRAVCETEGWECGRYFRWSERDGVLRFGGGWSVPVAAVEQFIEKSRDLSYAPGAGLAGRVWQTVQPLWVPDVTRDTRVATGTLFRDTGMRGAFVFPITSEAEGKPIGVLAFNSRQVREPDERLLKAILVIGSQIGQFLQRTRAEEEQRRFRVAMDASADLMLLIDRAGMRYIDVNDAACRALGYTREELLAMGPQDIFSKSREELAQLYDRMFASELTAPMVEGV